ncbi:Uncharacterized protein TCM_027490 [Theobroma cacao]|uniref:UBN2 domain-containing protein n=1 Tax=Theobroma cacao TaxID=3641 RepID=A0A061G8A2_THECC|nr:Uncharacterized protein TCM_027490 [Theobroma cacao]
MAIKEARNLNTFKLDGLVGSLLTYEMTFKHGNEIDDARKKDIKKKGVTLKSTIEEDEKSTKEENEENEDIALLVKRFNKSMRKKYRGRRPPRRDGPKCENSKDHLIFYNVEN